MALGPLGSAVVNADASVTKSGVVERAYDALGVLFDPSEQTFGGQVATLKQLRGNRATLATWVATFVYNELTTYAEPSITITTSDSGLQRTPDPNDPNTDTQAPSADKTLTGSIT